MIEREDLTTEEASWQ